MSCAHAYRNHDHSITRRQSPGPKTIRALALLAEIIYGTQVRREDPVIFSFAHGGKNGTFYPVDRTVYDRSIVMLKSAVERARIGDKDKLSTMKKLTRFGS